MDDWLAIFTFVCYPTALIRHNPRLCQARCSLFSGAGPCSTGIRAIKDSTNIALHVRAYVLATWVVQVQGRPSAHPAILFRLWQDR